MNNTQRACTPSGSPPSSEFDIDLFENRGPSVERTSTVGISALNDTPLLPAGGDTRNLGTRTPSTPPQRVFAPITPERTPPRGTTAAVPVPIPRRVQVVTPHRSPREESEFRPVRDRTPTPSHSPISDAPPSTPHLGPQPSVSPLPFSFFNLDSDDFEMPRLHPNSPVFRSCQTPKNSRI